MNRNALYLLLAVAIVVAAVLGYMLYDERQQESGVAIQMDKGGISVETK
ncbi:MAG: hypothetical protein RIB84_09695 [Sneathiellaceae bacterium]